MKILFVFIVSILHSFKAVAVGFGWKEETDYSSYFIYAVIACFIYIAYKDYLKAKKKK